MQNSKFRQAIRKGSFFLCAVSTIGFTLLLLGGIWFSWNNEIIGKIAQSLGVLTLASALILAITQSVDSREDREDG